MDSLDEFQHLESMIQKSEETLKRNRSKKPRTSSTTFEEIDSDMANDNIQLEFLKNIISTEFSNYQELNHRDELIRKICQRLHTALQNNEEIKRSEMAIAQEIQDMKHEMQQLSSYVNHQSNKNKIKSSKIMNHNETTTVNENDDESSLELCRKQILSQSSFLSQIDYNHIDFENYSLNPNENCDKSKHMKQNGGSVPSNGISFQMNSSTNTANVQMLIEQIKTLEKKIHTERQSYLEENERLNAIIDEKQKVIDDLESKQNNKLINNKSCDAIHSNNPSLPGLFDDWRIEDLNDSYQPFPSSNNTANNNHLDVSNNSYNQTNNRLLVVLSDLVQTFLDTENDIQKQLEQLGLEQQQQQNGAGGKGSPLKNDDLLSSFPSLEDERSLLMPTTNNEVTTFDLCEDGPDLTTPSSIMYSNPMSSTFVGSSTLAATSTNNDIEDDVVLGASRRLRFAVERVLKILADTLDHQKQDFKELLKQKEDLRLEFQEEYQRSDKLTRQLLEKENLIKNLEMEKKNLSEKLIDYNEIKGQHERLKEKLEEFERERDKFITDNKRLEMERKSFDQGLPQLHQKLLHENETLNRDIRLLQQDKKNLLTKINNLTSEVEMLKTEKDQIIESKNAEFEELISQLDSKEKNLNSLKRFIEEQTQERELEREEFSKEVSSLKDKIKEKEKFDNKMKSNIRSLESQIALLNDDKSQHDEQIEELNKNLKEANCKISELNLIKRQLESEVEKNNQNEKQLSSRLKKLSNVLQVKLNDETNWDEVMQAIDQFVVAKSQLMLTSSNNNGQRNQGPKSKDSETQNGQDLDNSIFTTIKLMDDKIQDLNKNIESLMSKNENLKFELKNKNELINSLEQFRPKMETLEQNLKKMTKTNELLQQEINDSHMKYSELKVKLDSSVDINEFKKAVNDLQNKLNIEKKQNETVSMKLEQANRHVSELTEKLDAYKKEIKSIREILKSNQDNNDKLGNKQDKINNSERRNSKDYAHEINQLNNKLEIKERTCQLQEQNIEILKSKLDAIQNERIKSLDDCKNKITIYEKNLEKLRLQNKISSDKITYLELEIQNLKKKIEILEKENELLKVENQKLMRQRSEMNAAAVFADYVDEPDLAMTVANANGNQGYINGFDKMNNISSNNLLMLKVRRLLTQKGALIYQKNYLIHALGTFQRTENATLAMMANYNYNNLKDTDEDGDNHEMIKMRGKSKFRSVVYGLIALNRMKFMVNIWKCRRRQLLFHKTANSIASLQNIPLPPRKLSKEYLVKENGIGPSSSVNTSPIHQHHSPSHLHLKHPTTSEINSTLKDYVDRLHVVHETLGIQTNKRL